MTLFPFTSNHKLALEAQATRPCVHTRVPVCACLCVLLSQSTLPLGSFNSSPGLHAAAAERRSRPYTESKNSNSGCMVHSHFLGPILECVNTFSCMRSSLLWSCFKYTPSLFLYADLCTARSSDRIRHTCRREGGKKDTGMRDSFHLNGLCDSVEQ